jgi:hypothetical protein
MPRDKSALKDAFWRNGFGFVSENRYQDAVLPKAFTTQRKDLHDTLIESKKLPDLKGAPVASWMLARIAFLAGRKFPYGWDEIVGSDGAEFWLRFYCLSEELALSGLLSVTGSNKKADLHVSHLREEDGIGICDAFIQEMLAEPSKLQKCRIIVQYTEMTDPSFRFIMPHIYGWDGRRFLDGISPAHAVDPDEYV